jgi:hypothetical protein
MKKYRAKIIIRANARGADQRQLNDDELKNMGWFKETDFEIIEAENIHRAADVLVNRYLPPTGIDDPNIEVLFDQDFMGSIQAARSK